MQQSSILKTPVKTSDSLLKATLLKGGSNIQKTRPPQETWSLHQQSDGEVDPKTSPPKKGSLSIKIKRTTPAKWQIKPKEEYTIVQVTPSCPT